MSTEGALTAIVPLRVPPTADRPALLLRPWRVEDVPALLAAHTDPVLRHFTHVPLDSPAVAERWVEAQEQGWERGDRFAFAVLEAAAGTEQGRLVGHAVVKGVAPGEPSAEVGYWTAAEARGLGVAPRALRALTEWAATELAPHGVQWLDLHHELDNPASCRVAEKCGYPWETHVAPDLPDHPAPRHLHRHSLAG